MCWKIFKQKFKVWKSFKFIDEFSLAPSIFEVADNGLALGAVADFGAQNCQYTTKVDAR